MRTTKYSSKSSQKKWALGIFLFIRYTVSTFGIETNNNLRSSRNGFNVVPPGYSHRTGTGTWLAKQYSHRPDESENSTLTNLVAVEVQQKELEEVLQIAKNLGFHLIRKVFEDEDIYLLRHKNVKRRSPRNTENPLSKLSANPRVNTVLPQYAVYRHRKSFISTFYDVSAYETALEWSKSPNNYSANNLDDELVSVHFNDPLYKDQWYLVNHHHHRKYPFQHDINVLPVWRAGINGSGVRISVLDDGVYMRNEEISHNYDSLLGFDFINLKDLRAEDVQENSHGTYCAAIAAGVANNTYCGVGVAYAAKVGGPRVLNDLITDVQEAMALIQALDYVDIYTASWGPKDDGKHLAGPGPLARMAFMKGVTQGRRGLGAIYVWAAGNGGIFDDDCNADGYASSPYTLTFGAVTDTGRSTYYSEPCAAVIASTYIGGFHHRPTMKDIAKLKQKIKVVVPEPHGKCRETFQGTSAAAPMASGVIALVLQANPRLSWRDVQHIIIECSRIPSFLESGWSMNAAGKYFHLKIGFGVLDATRMVAMAQNWKPVKPLITWTSSAVVETRTIAAGQVRTISLSVPKAEMESGSILGCLENVITTVNVTHPRCRDLEMFLISPEGTISQILTRRLQDQASHILMWNFTSLHFWGESPFGMWRFQIVDKGTYEQGGFINYFSLTFLGTSSTCLRQVTPMRNLNKKHLISLIKRNENLTRNIKLKPVEQK